VRKLRISILLTAITTLVVSAAMSACADGSMTVRLDPKPGVGNPAVQTTISAPPAHKTYITSRDSYKAEVHKTGASSREITIGWVGVVSIAKADIRAMASTRGARLFSCPKGTYVAIVGQVPGWYGVLMEDSSTGYIKTSSVTVLNYKVNTPTEPSNTEGNLVIRSALRYLGIPYRWGGVTAYGIDCSAFVRSVFAGLGVNLPRVAREQANVGTPVQAKDLQPGDRLYFACHHNYIDHAGIYMGGGYFIHSSAGRGGVAVDSIYKPLFARSLVSARRS
jgi:cell wall-associated NlpC family hydrolase